MPPVKTVDKLRDLAAFSGGFDEHAHSFPHGKNLKCRLKVLILSVVNGDSAVIARVRNALPRTEVILSHLPVAAYPTATLPRQAHPYRGSPTLQGLAIYNLGLERL